MSNYDRVIYNNFNNFNNASDQSEMTVLDKKFNINVSSFT